MKKMNYADAYKAGYTAGLQDARAALEQAAGFLQYAEQKRAEDIRDCLPGQKAQIHRIGGMK